MEVGKDRIFLKHVEDSLKVSGVPEHYSSVISKCPQEGLWKVVSHPPQQDIRYQRKEDRREWTTLPDAHRGTEGSGPQVLHVAAVKLTNR